MTSLLLCLLVLAPADGAAAEPAPSATVVGRAWLEIDPIRDESTVRLWVSIENGRPGTIERVTFTSLETPGFGRIGRCWIGATPSCLAGATSAGSLPAIASGDRLLAWADLSRERAEAARIVLTGTFTWSETPDRAGALPVVRYGSVSGGPVEMSAISWRGQPFGLYNEWAKELFLPLGLVLAAWILQVLQQRRTDRQTVWTQMLEKSATNAERFYMPIGTANQLFTREVRRMVSGNPQADLDAALFYLLLLNRRMRELANKIGGFYFKSRSGESLVQVSWRTFNERQREALGSIDIDVVLGAVGPTMTFGEYQEKVKGRPKLQAGAAALAPRLARWVADTSLVAELTLLDLFLYSLSVEMNRPFERWYGKAEAVSAAALTRYEARLAPFSTDGPIRDVAKRLETYRRETCGVWTTMREKWADARAAARGSF